MKVHESIAKELLRNFGVAVPRGEVVSCVEAVPAAIARLDLGKYVAKAQILAKGRSSIGGVKFSETLADLEKNVANMLGMNFVTASLGDSGSIVSQVLVEESIEFERKYALVFFVRRSTGRINLWVTGEDTIVPYADKETIAKIEIQPELGLCPFVGRKIAEALNLRSEQIIEFTNFLNRLYQFFCQYDCVELELSPFVRLANQSFMALDVRLELDDYALYRLPVAAKELIYQTYFCEDGLCGHGVDLLPLRETFYPLEGNIGVMVNGAGLAMATLDLMRSYGGLPANFWDIGGGASTASVKLHLEKLLRNPRVQTLLIHIFGGITKCDCVVQGVVELFGQLMSEDKDEEWCEHLRMLPIVVRLEGTNFVLAKKILRDSGLNIQLVGSFDDAVKRVVALADGRGV